MKNIKKHIVIVSSEFPPQPGGIGNHAFNLALYLTKEQYEVSVIADQRSINGIEEQNFDKAQPFSVYRIKRHSYRTIMYLKRIVTTYKSFKNADYVIATGKFSLWNVAMLSAIKKTKTMAVIHGTEVNFKSFALRKSIDFALKRIKTVVAVSHYTKSLVSHLNINVNVIPNGIDMGLWENEELQSVPLKGNPVLTTVGRVSSRKGQLNVIKLLPKLIKEFPNLHYHCIGIPSEADQFLKIAKDLNVESFVTFHGEVEHITLKQMLYSTDIFVMLSSESKTGDVEGFGIAILEANALGVPSIGSNGCGIADAIKDRVSGILIDLNSSNEFKEAVTSILNDINRYKKESKKWARSHDWSNIIKQYTDLLN